MDHNALSKFIANIRHIAVDNVYSMLMTVGMTVGEMKCLSV